MFGQGNGLRCTWVFYEDAIGKEYLFYLDSPPEDGNLWYEYGLRRSHVLEKADDDLLYLNKMDKVRGRTRISGVLHHDGLAGLSLEGQTITLKHGESVNNLSVVIKVSPGYTWKERASVGSAQCYLAEVLSRKSYLAKAFHPNKFML